MKKKDPRGRKQKMHKAIPVSFDGVLSAIGQSKYKDEKSIGKKTKATK